MRKLQQTLAKGQHSELFICLMFIWTLNIAKELWKTVVLQHVAEQAQVILLLDNLEQENGVPSIVMLQLRLFSPCLTTWLKTFNLICYSGPETTLRTMFGTIQQMKLLSILLLYPK